MVCHIITGAYSSFANTRGGQRLLTAWLQQHGVEATTPCVVESTGDYHLLSAVTLTRAGYTVNVINPLITKQYQRASIRGAKTDAIDAARLAKIGLLEANLRPFQPDEAVLWRKKLIAQLAQLEKIKQQLTASTRHLESVSRQIGLPFDDDHNGEIMTALEKQITRLTDQLVESTDPAACQFAENMSGISVRQMAVLTAALGEARFASRDQLVAFVGLDVRLRRSGSWRGTERISKRGHPYVRKTLYQAAWGLRLNDPGYRTYYERLRKNGKHYNTAMTAVARKFVRHFYAAYWSTLS